MDGRATPVDLDELLSHAGWVRALARRLARDQASAEDLVRETWLAALRKPPRPGPDLRGWLGRVLTNFARRHERGERRRRDREARAPRAGSGSSGAQLALEVDEQQQIAGIVLGLAEPYRSVILRHYWRGESLAEIARSTGRPAATVRSQLARARGRLREALETHYRARSRDPRAGLLIAAGTQPSSWFWTLTRGALIVKQSQKLGWVVVAMLATVIAAGVGWVALDPADESATAESLATGPPPPAAVQPDAVAPAESSGRRRALVDEPVAEPSATRLAARFVDAAGTPIPGAFLRLRDVRDPRDPSSAARSDADGRVRLALAAADLRRSRGRLSPSRFVAECEGYVTRFLVATPRLGKEVDLGEMILEPGGRVSGRVVDGDGASLDAITVYATGVELHGPLAMVRSRGPREPAEAPSAVSRAGAFAIAGVPAGHARLWARTRGTGWVVSDPIAVRAGGESGGHRIVLAPLPAEDLIRGVVLDPSGNPIPRARLTYQFQSESIGYRYGAADASGRFEIVAEIRGPHDLRVEDRERRWRSTVVRGVVAGPREITVELAEPAWMQVVVTDARSGEPVGDPWVYTRGADTLEYDSRAARRTDERGSAERSVCIPQHTFTLHVRREGFEDFEVGPFEPATAPRRLEARLTPAAAVRGTVTLDGRPVTGAHVELLKMRSPLETLTSYGFPMRMNPFGESATETGPAGRFAISVKEAGTYALIVRKAGSAVAERGPFELDPERDLAGVDVALRRGGTIEGHVYVATGRDPAGLLVSASRGDGDVRFTRTDGEGVYRFTNLTPGGWHVAHRDREAARSVTFGLLDEPPPSIEWDCEVVDGRVTVFDLDRRAVSSGVLRGRLLLDGAGAQGWSASLTRDAGVDVIAPVRPVTLAADGTFELRGALGEWRLWLRNPVGAPVTVLAFADVVLGAEPTEWSCALITGTLSGHSRAGAADLRLRSTAPGGTRLSATFTPAADGGFHVPVPAGRATLLRAESAEDHPGAMQWRQLREITIAAGATVSVELD